MPRVTILSRELIVRSNSAGQPEHVLAVIYSSTAIPPRTIYPPLFLYRNATAEELIANPRIHYYPKDQSTQDRELQAIRQDFDLALSAAPPTFDLP
jgi:hypothetical protein